MSEVLEEELPEELARRVEVAIDDRVLIFDVADFYIRDPLRERAEVAAKIALWGEAATEADEIVARKTAEFEGWEGQKVEESAAQKHPEYRAKNAPKADPERLEYLNDLAAAKRIAALCAAAIRGYSKKAAMIETYFARARREESLAGSIGEEFEDRAERTHKLKAGMRSALGRERD